MKFSYNKFHLPGIFSMLKNASLRSANMAIKEQLMQEIESAPDALLAETLNFLRFLKTKETQILLNNVLNGYKLV
ncbi:hypothetical protein [Komarekiella delphini-convector]|uniref:hypothetical protein n=1 Tax=Komarekiella delphini-convector TaxID=3050158 RepID=UPI001CD848EB|nr:hypothetical protein [Komarekiella delphini-convector]